MPPEGKQTSATTAADALFETEIRASTSHSWLRSLHSALSWFARQFLEGLAAYGATICVEFSHPLYDEIHSCEVQTAKRKAHGSQKTYEVVHLKRRSAANEEAEPLTSDELIGLEKFIAELRQGG
jgi:hypothetical protein